MQMSKGKQALVAGWAVWGLTAWLAAAAQVDLTLYNTEALLDQDGVTKLEGDASGGDLVQLILAGPNGVADVPQAGGAPGGDDTLVSAANNPTHVGVGYVSAGTGKLTQSGLLFNDSLVGSNAYVRFWNAATAGTATHYGNSLVLALPAPDGFGQADLDFVPLTSSPRTTTNAAVSVPTLTEAGILVLVALLVWIAFRHLTPEAGARGIA